ncbi:MAG: hypothetical protein Q8R18_05915 [bacterium]|nr:hypothetical protein [bacterium]
MGWLKIFGIGLVVLIIIIVLYIFFQENHQKYYRKARRAHKRGESAYTSGDFELAESLYAKAEEYRKKAQELE